MAMSNHPARFLRYLVGLLGVYSRVRYNASQRPVKPVRPPLRPRDAVFPAHYNHRQPPYTYPEYSRVKSDMGWSLLVVLSLVTVVHGQLESCLSVDQDPYFLFGTKTAYIFANKEIPSKRPHDVPGCQPIAFWLLNRHGSHNPDPLEIRDGILNDLKNNIITNYRNGNYRNFNERICQSDLNALENWQPSVGINPKFAGALTSDGYITTQQLAQAWRQKFSGLLTGNRHDYLFKFVRDQRSDTTFKAFTEGLLGADAAGFDIPKENDEKIVKPPCPAWKTNVEQNNDTLSQRYIFESKREYREMITNISHRLGFNWDLDKEIVLQMYQMCRYNKAWDFSHISPWCVAFTKEDLRRLEYAEDLETYYKYGYGSNLNQKLGCTFVKEMMNFFTNHVENENLQPQQPRNVIHFVEAAEMLLTMTAMGAHHDSVPLTGDNYHTNPVQSRKWSTSNMVPFNGNIAAALYKCTSNGNFQVNDQYQVLFLENEKPMALEGCRVGLCEWSYIKNKFGEIASNCDLKFCNGAANLNGFVGLSVALIAFFTKYVAS